MLVVMSQRAPSTDQSQDQPELTEPEDASRAASRFLGHPEQEKLLQKAPHTSSFHGDKLQWRRQG